MKTRRETGSGPDKTAKLLPENGGELRTPIRNHIRGQTMYLENIIDHNLGCLFGRRELSERDEMS